MFYRKGSEDMSQPLRRYLECQADRVEAVLAAHRAPGYVTGGAVGPRLVRFFVDPAPNTRFSTLRALADDLALALRVPSLCIERGKEGVVLEFPNPEPHPVTLLSLLSDAGPLPLSTALLGLTEEGKPLLARLSSPDVAHVLIAGTTGSGKSALLRAIAVSLVLSHHPAALRLLCVDIKGRTFRSLGGAPHLLRPPVMEAAEAVEALRSLVRVMELRDRRGENAPRIVLMIDELADLLFQESELAGRQRGVHSQIAALLTRLVQRGREAGIHVIAATQRPSSAILDGLLRANFPLRLVGKVASPEDARIAAGRGGTNAHLLNGRGDFLAVGTGPQSIRFQVALIEDADAQQAVVTLPYPRPALSPPQDGAPAIVTPVSVR
jgi:S-DNA-T family DNA segregation ATPase FtsK/SpoIIIE